MLPFLFFTSRSKRVSFCPHTWQVKVNGIFASRAIKTRHAGSALKEKVLSQRLLDSCGRCPLTCHQHSKYRACSHFPQWEDAALCRPMPFPFLLCRFTGEARTALSSFARLAKRRCEITIISFSRSICHGGLAALTGVTGKPYPSRLSCHSHPIRPFRAPSPRGEGCDTRIPSSKKRRRSRHESPEP